MTRHRAPRRPKRKPRGKLATLNGYAKVNSNPELQKLDLAYMRVRGGQRCGRGKREAKSR